MNKRQVVLVDEKDKRLGTMEVLEAHKGVGRRHRAISVVLHDGKGRVLLQRRSGKKLLWPGFWSNSMCTHPKDGEGHVSCAVRRLKEELGIRVKKVDLSKVYRFAYKARYSESLSENELDTVMVGKYEGEVFPNPDEVSRVMWMSWDEVKERLYREPDKFTPWFKLMVDSGKLDKFFD